MRHVFIFILIAARLLSAEHFVSLAGGGTHDGSSWANAWTLAEATTSTNWGTSGSTKIIPGDTVYIDGGSSGVSYSGGFVFQRAGTAGNVITVRPGAGHPTLSSGHDGKVVLGGIEGDAYSYIRVDGS